MNIRPIATFLAPCLLLSAVAYAQVTERIANEGTIGDKWMLADGATLASAQYPAHLADRGDNVCIALVYKIGKDGTTSDLSVLKQWNSESGEKEPVDGFYKAFAEAGADAVLQWKFKPRPDVSKPVPTRTVATLGFTGKTPVDAAELRSHCQVGDLAAQLKARPNRNDFVNKQLRQDQQAARAGEIQAQLRRQNGGN